MTKLLIDIPEEGSDAYVALSNVILLHSLNVKQISFDEKDIEEKAQKAFSHYRKDKFGLSRVTKQVEGYKQALKDLI